MHIQLPIHSLPADHSKYALTPGQKALLFIHTLGGKAQSAYNEPIVYALKGPLLLDALQGVVDTLIKKHPMLRAGFAQDEQGDVFQFLDESARVDIRYITSPSQDVSELINEEIERPFELHATPLMRISVISTSPTDHMLVLVFHHIVIDGTSLAILLNDFCTYYNQLAAGEPITEPASSTLQYLEEVNTPRSAEYQDKVTAMVDTLRGYNTLNFPLSPTYPAANDPFAGDRFYFPIEADLYRKIRELAKKHKVTVFHVLLAAYSIFIGRYTRTEDVVIGAPFAGRGQNLERDVVGYYVNTMPIRISLESDQTFTQLLSGVRNAVFSCLAKQEVAFEDVAAHLNLSRRVSGQHPLIQTLLNWVPQGDAMSFSLHGIEASPYHTYFSQTAKFNLSLFLLEETTHSITAYFEYQTSLFDRATIQHLAASFCTLLRHITEHSDHALSSLRIIDTAEEQRIAKDFFVPVHHDSQTNISSTDTLSSLFTQVGQHHGTHSALVFGEQIYSYQVVLDQADRWAHYIRARYVDVYGTPMPAGALIALCLPRHPDMIFAILGVLKAGGAYVPIDPLFPKERIDYILSDSQAALFLTHKQCYLADLNIHEETVIYMDDPATQAELSAHVPDALPEISSQTLAYVIYTSGSTGQPKGVPITHANVLSLFRSAQQRVSFSDQDVWSLFHTYCFDVSVWEIWGALLFGGTLVILPHETTRDPKKLYELIATQEVTMLAQTPLAFQMIINQDTASTKKLPLRYVFLAGESLKLSILKPWIAKYGTDKPVLMNLYGPTEATIYTTCKTITLEGIERERDNIGKALPGRRLSIVDDQCQWCPIGFVGEICIGGKGLTQGYLNRTELTAEKFINDRYAALLGLDPKEKLYRTGDLGRWLADGSVEYLGRKDFQVKLRGFRIELGEIESALERFTQVAQALVLLKGEGENAYLSAYYTAKPGQQIEESALFTHLRSSLPSYMVPQRLTQLDTFSLTLNGKIDRNVLLQRDDLPNAIEAHLIPSTKIQQDIASIWADVLKIDRSRIGLRENFFSLGGNSLLVVKMLALLKNKLGYAPPINQFMAAPTVASLAGDASEKEQAGASLIDWIKQKVALCPSIQPLPEANPHLSAPKVILLTGVTGFLGAHILAEASKNKAIETIYCLVRADTITQADERIKQQLHKYRLLDVLQDRRIIPVLGDLAQPQLGWSDEQFNQLAHEVDAIFHVGATVNHILDFDALYASNVQSSYDILRLATLGKNKAVHFVSTLAAALLEPIAQQGQELGFLSSGYITTKYASEYLMHTAFQRGIAAYVYRPGNIIAGENGVYEPENNHTLLRLKGMLQLGKAYVAEHESVEMVPVDALAKAIMTLAMQRSHFSYNLHNGQSLSWRDYLTMAKDHGFEVEWITDFTEWEEILAQLDESNALYRISWLHRMQQPTGIVIEPNYSIPTPSYAQMVHQQLGALYMSGFLPLL